ncbi:MAG: DUF7594 domain-containing protein, partial [Bacillota bacterium]
MRNKKMLILFALVLAFVQAVFTGTEARAADLTIITNSDKSVDNTDVYYEGYDVSPHGKVHFVGYERDSTMDYGSARAALKFDLSGVDTTKTIDTAILKVFVKKTSSYDAGGGTVYQPFVTLLAADDDSWAENTTVIPSTGQILYTNDYNLIAGQWKTFDVTDFIKAESSGDGTASFVLSGTNALPPGAPQTVAIQMLFSDRVVAGCEPCLEITYAPAAFSIAAAPALAEGSLDGRQVTVTLSGTTFADATLDKSNFTLVNAPAGLAVDVVSHNSGTTATVSLSHDGSDFDTSPSLGITIAGAELAGGSPLTSANSLTITAVDDAESIALSQAADIWEGEEDGKKITVTLSGGTFAPVLTDGNWPVTGLPGGVSRGTLTRVDSHTVEITLSGNATADYDTNITNVTVTPAASEYRDSSGGGALSASSGITLRARTAPSVTTGAAGTITATAATVGGEVTSDGNLPVTARGIEYKISTDSSYTAVPSGTGTGTFSVNLSGLTPNTTYNARAYAVNTEGTSYGGVETFTTQPVTANIAAAPALAEGSLDGRQVTVTLSGTTFADATLDKSNFTLVNAPAGLAVDVVSH